MYDAWDAASRRERVRLARKALRITPACNDAYVLLAEEAAEGLDDALDLYRRGTEAGEVALGAEAFEEDVGYFWSILETRPYMRARAGLAQALWEKGEREGAVEHYRDMLRLNPDDNQGLRYLLAGCYLDMGRDDDLAELLSAYEEDASALWLYTRAVAVFLREGDSERSRSVLAEALKTNSHVPAYLLGRKSMPKRLPPYISWGGEDEAVACVAECGGAWRRSTAALQWLRQSAADFRLKTKR